MKGNINVIVKYHDDEDPQKIKLEGMWATHHGKYYQLNNIPFFSRSLALGDIVSGEAIGDEVYVVELIEESGNSTIRILFLDTTIVNETIEYLNLLGCNTSLHESGNFLAVNVPRNINYYKQIKPYLDKGEMQELWNYEEACLAHTSE